MKPSSRLKPVQAGLVNVWDYTYQTFEFADGRLVLRGHNGSGKTTALEMLFPLLLDGNTSPYRINPFGGGRSLKDHVTHGRDKAAYGYAWITFADGNGQCVSIGMGIHARPETARAKTWFFCVKGAVGVDFDVVTSDGRPRTKRELIEVLGPDAINDTAQAHRAAIDRRLFGFGRERYDAMIELVLQLRRPKLTEHLNPDSLADVLRDSLRPLDETLVDDAASSFDDLERAQSQLDAVRRIDDATSAFTSVYRQYLRAELRTRSESVLDAEVAVSHCQAEIAKTEAAHDAASTAERSARQRRDEIEALAGRTRAKLEGLLASPAFKEAGRLNLLAEQVVLAKQSVERDERRLADVTSVLAAAQNRLSEVSDAASAAEQYAAERAKVLLARSRDATVDLADDDLRVTLDELRALLHSRHDARHGDIEAVKARATESARAEHARELAEGALDAARNRLDTATDQLAEAEEALDAARVQWKANLDRWGAKYAEIIDDSVSVALTEAAETVGEPGVTSPSEVVFAALRPHRDGLLDSRHHAQSTLGDLNDVVASLQAHRALIAAETDDAPPAAHTRVGDRKDRPGAPLWQLVRFADGVDENVCAHVEAALEASGLLDAWVWPGNTASEVLDQVVGDSRLVQNNTGGSGTDGPALDAILVPDEESGPDTRTDTDIVTTLLASIPLTAGAVHIGTDGSFRLGPLAGTYTKPAAQYVGASARARNRRHRLAEIDMELAHLANKRLSLQAELDAIATALAALDIATAALPLTTAIDSAVTARTRATGRLEEARVAVGECEARLADAAHQANSARQTLDAEARSRHLPADTAGLDRITTALGVLSRTGDDLIAARRDALRVSELVAAAHKDINTATAQQIETVEDLAHAKGRHDALASQVEAIREALGAKIDDVIADVDKAREALRGLEADMSNATATVETAISGTAAAKAHVETATAAIDGAVAERTRSVSILLAAASPDMLTLIDLSPPAGETDPLHQARKTAATIDAQTAGTSTTEERRKQITTQVTNGLETLREVFERNIVLHWELDTAADGLLVVTVSDDETPSGSLARFAAEVAAKRAEQQQLLSESERHVLEETLLRGLIGQMHERLGAARTLIDSMNTELHERRTSSGMTITIGRQRADDAPLPIEVLDLFLSHPATMRPDQLATLRDHVVGEVRARHMEIPGIPYRDHLASVLDYRRWHRFVFHLLTPAGTETLTRRRHAKLSGGERVVVMYLPLFAAANVLFSTADQHCPRLVAMDEAFEGCDDTAQESLFDLMVAFDLDIFLTGAKLWATFPSIPSVAHYDLVHDDSLATVAAMRLVWNGHDLEADSALAELRVTDGFIDEFGLTEQVP